MHKSITRDSTEPEIHEAIRAHYLEGKSASEILQILVESLSLEYPARRRVQTCFEKAFYIFSGYARLVATWRPDNDVAVTESMNRTLGREIDAHRMEWDPAYDYPFHKKAGLEELTKLRERYSSYEDLPEILEQITETLKVAPLSQFVLADAFCLAFCIDYHDGRDAWELLTWMREQEPEEYIDFESSSLARAIDANKLLWKDREIAIPKRSLEESEKEQLRKLYVGGVLPLDILAHVEAEIYPSSEQPWLVASALTDAFYLAPIQAQNAYLVLHGDKTLAPELILDIIQEQNTKLKTEIERRRFRWEPPD